MSLCIHFILLYLMCYFIMLFIFKLLLLLLLFIFLGFCKPLYVFFFMFAIALPVKSVVWQCFLADLYIYNIQYIEYT